MGDTLYFPLEGDRASVPVGLQAVDFTAGYLHPRKDEHYHQPVVMTRLGSPHRVVAQPDTLVLASSETVHQPPPTAAGDKDYS